MTSTSVRVAAFGGGLAVAFGAAFALGSVVTPYDRGSDTGSAQMGEMSMSSTQAEPGAVPGLAVAASGYTFVPATTTLARGPAVPFAFEIDGPGGQALTDYEPTHTKELHLIVVRRDLSGFQHVHPTQSADGTWRVPLDLSEGGTYRAFADFQPVGHAGPVVLGVDLQVGGGFEPVPLPAPATTTTVDGYDVTLRGTPASGHASNLTFAVSRDGRPVDALEPYLGAFGHLVSLRVGDLAYLHTHPSSEAKPGEHGGPDIQFMAEFPTRGSYRLFLDFAAGGQVHTAEFTLAVSATDGSGPTPDPTHAPAHSHTH